MDLIGCSSLIVRKGGFKIFKHPRHTIIGIEDAAAGFNKFSKRVRGSLKRPDFQLFIQRFASGKMRKSRAPHPISGIKFHKKRAPMAVFMVITPNDAAGRQYD
jgi:hypothetical protein